MARLSKGRELVSDVTENIYRVKTGRIAQGGFGEVYRGEKLDDHRDPCRSVAIKVTTVPWSWHGEAYFGRLLEGQSHVVPLLDAFPIVDGSGRARLVKYILVFDWMSEGTVDDLLMGNGPEWTEDHVLQQIRALLKVLVLLHRRGICHGDITPRNIFVEEGRLLLGDLGIAKQGLMDGPLTLDGMTPPAFAPLGERQWYWSVSDDVYQVGLIALSLLAYQEVTSDEVGTRLLRTVKASDHLKGWIRDAVAPEPDRFSDASEALAALSNDPVKSAQAPRTLKNQKLVFTGVLPITRAAARRRAERAGAMFQDRVNGATTLIVAGQPNPLQIGRRSGTKLFDARRRIRRGQRIAIINADQFERLLTRAGA